MRQPAKNEGTVHNKKYEDYFHLFSKGRKKKTGKEKAIKTQAHLLCSHFR